MKPEDRGDDLEILSWLVVGPWRWFDESMLDSCESLEKIKAEGIAFGKAACLAHCNGAKVEAFRTNQTTIDDFRKYVMICTSSEDCHMITSYYRPHLEQSLPKEMLTVPQKLLKSL
ncbi:hypothetical protein HHK36_027006 [Tetracentron sinense]|uniref:glutathione gamma-glutamylcysteinyltransferase n=1 Tax=Tetracentron sinense TaxID=13715 RepID=A0A834YHU3_TETSI|nr:hypothetical protein HHK36_027006 [Tetracentron sinense]